MSDLNIQNSLFETMKIFSEYAVTNSDAAKTIEAKIVEISDEASGIYKVEYFSNTFEVHSSNNSSYSVGDDVYILVPNGDFTKELVIIGLVSASDNIYINNTTDSANYYDISSNILTSDTSNLISFCSYAGRQTLDISSYISTDTKDLFKNYLQDYRTVRFGFKAKTNLPQAQRFRGNYGILLSIPVVYTNVNNEEESDNIIVTLDVGNMLGSPYDLTVWTDQYLYFTIDEQYSLDTEKDITISAFCYDFIENSEKTTEDIFIEDISLSFMDSFVTDTSTGYSLAIIPTNGKYFIKDTETKKTLSAKLRLNGKNTSLTSSDIYWFQEDTSVRSGASPYYVSYGGNGWKCINTIGTTTINDDGTKTFSFITKNQSAVIDIDDVPSRTRYKCVVIHNSKTISAEIELKNITPAADFGLVSATGSTVCIENVGYVDLIAKIFYNKITNVDWDEKSDVPQRSDITYSWSRYDKEDKLLNDDSSFFECLQYNERVDNEFYTEIRFPVNEINQYNTICCSAYALDSEAGIEKLVGTRKIVISTSTDFEYNLIINNDDIIYKYDSDGDSPRVAAYDGPSTSKVNSIAPLTYTFKKGDGTELTEYEYKFCTYSWKIPKNQMFTIYNSDKEDPGDGYYYVNGTGHGSNSELIYDINARFNSSKALNSTISLTVSFKDTSLTENTTIGFIKEGMSGTNGTSYVGRILCNGAPYGELDSNGVAKKLKFLYNIYGSSTKKTNGFWCYYAENEGYKYDTSQTGTKITTPIISGNAGRIFTVDVWKDGAKITKGYTVDFSIFNGSKEELICFGIDTADDKAGLYFTNDVVVTDGAETISKQYCNIIEAKITIEGESSVNANEIVYCYYPIEITVVDTADKITNPNECFIPYIDGGFDEVMYASDGTNPSWDSTIPFSFSFNLGEIDNSKVLDSIYDSRNWLAFLGNSDSSSGSGSGAEYAPSPVNKYDYLIYKHLVAGSAQIKTVKDTIDDLSDEKTFYEKLQEIVTTFKDNYLSYYSNWINEVNNINDYFIAKKSLLKRANDCKDALNIVINNDTYKNDYMTQYQSSFSIIKYYLDSIIDALNSKIVDRCTDSTYMTRSDAAIETLSALSPSDVQFANLLSSFIYYYNLFKTIRNESFLTTTIVDNYSSLQTLIRTNLNTLKIDLTPVYYSYCNDLVTKIDNKILENKFESAGSVTDLISAINEIYNSYLYNIIITDNETECELSTYINNYITNKLSYIEDNQTELSKQDTITKYINKVNDGKSYIVYSSSPVVFYYDRYEMSNINGWDGNKVEINDGYILTPQIGAGEKDINNRFTGVIMGIKNISSTGDYRKGLFGYADGVQSFCLDAENGAAVLGKSGAGQIIMDPSAEKGLLYSNTYWKKYDESTGLPSSYGTSNINNEGMLIDLTTPEIRFGNGNFVLTSEGNVTIAGTNNTIGGWKVTDTQIYSNISESNGRLTLDSGSTYNGLDENHNKTYTYGNGKIYSHSHNTYDSTNTGFYLSYDGLSLGSAIRIESADDGKVYVGNLKSSANKYWTISGDSNNAYISYKNKNDKDSVYLSTSEFSIGQRFYVNAEYGDLRLGKGAVDNSSTKHWTISVNGDNSYIVYNMSNPVFVKANSDDSTSNSIYLGTDGFTIGRRFSVSAAGELTAYSGNIGGWNISKGSLTSSTSSGKYITLNSNGSIEANYSEGNSGWKIESNGNAEFNSLTANKSGTIGGWTIGKNSLSANGISISASGSISNGSSWSISNKGTATFNTIYANGGYIGNSSNTISTDGGLAFSSGSIGLGTVGKGYGGISYGNGSCSISGDIYANNGYFSGEIQAKSGQIGGWTIGSDSLYGSSNVYLSTTGISAPTILGFDSGGFKDLTCATFSASSSAKVGGVAVATTNDLADLAHSGTYTISVSVTVDPETGKGSGHGTLSI